MDDKLLSPLDQDILAFDRGYSHFTLERRAVFRRSRLSMVFSSLAASCRRCAENPFVPAVQISRATSHFSKLLFFGCNRVGKELNNAGHVSTGAEIALFLQRKSDLGQRLESRRG